LSPDCANTRGCGIGAFERDAYSEKWGACPFLRRQRSPKVDGIAMVVKSNQVQIVMTAVWAGLLSVSAPALAQRVTGIDISAWQGNLSQANWNTIRNTDGKSFVFIRSSRGGTTGYYNQNDADNSDGLNTLSQRYDDPYFVQNITRATNAGIYAGSYHFGRMDIIASTLNSNGIPNNGTDEANHFIQMAGAWMRPGYLLPVFDFEAGINQRTPSELAQFAIDFSSRIYAVMGIRPAVYIGNNYASPMNSIPESAAVVAAYPTLWTARWPNQADPNSINIQGTDPGDYTSTVYGPWDNPPNPADPWHFWQYASTGRLQGINNGNSNVDLDVAHGGIEYVKDHLVPALWLSDASGNWGTLANWNSGHTPVAPIQGPGQVPRAGSLTLPTPRLPGAAGSSIADGWNDTVILDRPSANVTVTLSSGSYNIRKLYAREALAITGGSLTINYDPTVDSTATPISAQFSGAVLLASGASLSVHTLQVDAARTFTLAGGSLAFNKINLMPGATPATMLIAGNVNFSPLADAATVIANGSGAGSSGVVNLGGAARTLTVANGASAVDVSINVPVTNGALTKLGAGTLALNAANTYTGDTRVEAGQLRLGAATLADLADVYLSSGASLNLNFSGNPDAIRGLYFDGIAQAAGVWGAIGSGAPFTTSLISGPGRLSVGDVGPPLPPGPAGNAIDDFEIDEGHFNWNYNYSPASQSFGLASGPANSSGPSDRVTTEHQGAGVASQLIDLVIDATGDNTWQLRHNSGIGANLAAQPAGNVPLAGTGYVGFWLKTDDPGITVRIGIDDPVGGNTALERGTLKNVIADNQWHLYQWNFEDPGDWVAFAGGANGQIDAAGGTVTIDSIWLAGAGNAQLYLDNVMHNPFGMITPGYIAGDYNGDGLVTDADYAAWRSTFGQLVPHWTGADGNGDGVVDKGDYVLWRKQMTAGGAGASVGLAAVPEPTAALLPAILAMLHIVRRARRAFPSQMNGTV
jgi:autotransporter-associated beta strand protein